MKGRVLSRGRLAVFDVGVRWVVSVIIRIRGRKRGFGALPRTSLASCRARPVGSSAVRVGRASRRRWWALDAAGRVWHWVRRRAQGALVVGRRFADCVPAWEEAPVIHSVARGGPECRAVLGGSINPTAVLLDVAEEEARHRSELARACTSRPRGARESVVSWRWSCGLGQFVVVVVDRGLVFEAADLAVAQPVVAEGEDLAGDRDLRDLAPAAFGDPLEHGA
jgi:hypothetical protein